VHKCVRADAKKKKQKKIYFIFFLPCPCPRDQRLRGRRKKIIIIIIFLIKYFRVRTESRMEKKDLFIFSPSRVRADGARVRTGKVHVRTDALGPRGRSDLPLW
jgi:hypothetical protein